MDQAGARPGRWQIAEDPGFRRAVRGDRAQFDVVDTRQYRANQACGDDQRIGCEDRIDPTRTMLGADQERWLSDGLARSKATWNVMANQIFVTQGDSAASEDQAPTAASRRT